MAEAEEQSGNLGAIAMAVRGLAVQAEVAVRGFKERVGRRLGDATQGLVRGAPADLPTPWLDYLANEVHAAGDRLRKGL